MGSLEFRSTTKEYPDLFTPTVLEALEALAPLNATGGPSWRPASRARRERSRAGGASSSSRPTA